LPQNHSPSPTDTSHKEPVKAKVADAAAEVHEEPEEPEEWAEEDDRTTRKKEGALWRACAVSVPFAVCSAMVLVSHVIIVHTSSGSRRFQEQAQGSLQYEGCHGPGAETHGGGGPGLKCKGCAFRAPGPRRHMIANRYTFFYKRQYSQYS